MRFNHLQKIPRYYIQAKPEIGNQILNVNNLSKELGGELLFDKLNFTVEKGDKIAIRSKNSLAVTKLLEILAEEGDKTDKGDFEWGVTTTKSFLPNENSHYFEGVNLNLVDWLRQYSEEKDETFIRGFLGRMLFSGEETLKMCDVLSGGEKVRCLLSKIMLEEGNYLF